jgi:tellurite resistance protein TerC
VTPITIHLIKLIYTINSISTLEEFVDFTIVLIILQLIFLEGILSIDNAAVLGAMVVHLPDDRLIPWPQWLRHSGHRLDHILGNQRTAALRVGLLGAYLGRGLMLLVASLVAHNFWLKLFGALYLVRLAFDNLSQAECGEVDGHAHPIEKNSFWAVVLTVEMTDLVFSLDNVVAAVALSDKLWVVMVGVAIGILLMRFAAGWFSYWVEREPILKTAAYILVLNIGVEILVSELAGIKIPDLLRFGISVATILLSLAYAHIKPLQLLRPVFVWLGEGCGNFNEVFDWALVPVNALFGLGWRLIKRPFSLQAEPVQEK